MNSGRIAGVAVAAAGLAGLFAWLFFPRVGPVSAVSAPARVGNPVVFSVPGTAPIQRDPAPVLTEEEVHQTTAQIADDCGMPVRAECRGDACGIYSFEPSSGFAQVQFATRHPRVAAGFVGATVMGLPGSATPCGASVQVGLQRLASGLGGLSFAEETNGWVHRCTIVGSPPEVYDLKAMSDDIERALLACDSLAGAAHFSHHTEKLDVVVATRAIAEGMRIHETDVRAMEVVRAAIAPGLAKEPMPGVDHVVGQTASLDIQVGWPLWPSSTEAAPD